MGLTRHPSAISLYIKIRKNRKLWRYRNSLYTQLNRIAAYSPYTIPCGYIKRSDPPTGTEGARACERLPRILTPC